MGTFACRMHLLINLDPAATKGLEAFEEAVCLAGSNPHSFEDSSCGSLRLARTAANGFTMRGSQTAGTPVMWDMYLRGKQQKNYFLTYHGHWMNIAFHNCAAVYHHRANIRDFLNDWPDPNRLLRSIHFDCKENLFLAGCR